MAILEGLTMMFILKYVASQNPMSHLQIGQTMKDNGVSVYLQKQGNNIFIKYRTVFMLMNQ